MTTPIRKVALLSASGHLGPHLLSALTSSPLFHPTILTRRSSPATFPPSVPLIRISDDYPTSELIDAFRGHDAVVLCVNHAAEKDVPRMVDASVEAGVRWVIPPLFGGRRGEGVRGVFPFAGGKEGMMRYVEGKVEEGGEEGGWGFTGVGTGLFFELCAATNFFGIDPTAKTATIWGDGSTRFSCSTYAGISQAVISILENPARTKNQTVYISSFEFSLNELLDAYKTIFGDEGWEVEHKEIDSGIEEARQKVGAEDFMTRMKAIGRLALLSTVKPALGGDFVESGISWNEELGVEREDLVEVLRRVLGR